MGTAPPDRSRRALPCDRSRRLYAIIIATVLLTVGWRGAASASPARLTAVTPAPTAAPTTAPTLTAPTAVPSPTTVATPTPAPTSTAIPASLPSIYYAISGTVYAVDVGGSPIAVASLPPGNTFQPVLLPDGRLLYPTGSDFAVVDRYGRRDGLRTPDLNAGESVWSVVPSPDGRTLAWQLFAPQQVGSDVVNTGVSRIVLTSRFGDAGRTVFSAQASTPDGQVPLLLGWRATSPYSLGGGPTLLLQNLYSQNDARAHVLLNSTRGLLEYDPAIGDLVDDYLPPLSGAIPPDRAFSLSGDGAWALYGDSNVLTPSGEGPLAQALDALNLNSNAVVHLDTARNYPDKTRITTTTRHKSGKRTITTKKTTTLPLYQYFSHHAYVAPGDGRVLYTLLSVSYPPGALLPKVQQTTLVATMDGRSHGVVAKDALAAGWLDDHTAVVTTATGLEAIDVTSGSVTTLASGRGITFIGAR